VPLHFQFYPLNLLSAIFFKAMVVDFRPLAFHFDQLLPTL
jgi:hypothetical protein